MNTNINIWDEQYAKCKFLFYEFTTLTIFLDDKFLVVFGGKVLQKIVCIPKGIKLCPSHTKRDSDSDSPCS